MSQPNQHFYEFGPFRIDPVKRLLFRAGSPVPLPPKAFDTLLVLVQHAGDLINKSELMEEVWADAFVEENNLNQSISLLRKALGETRQQPRYIVTAPGRGYRFVADVQERWDEETEVALHRSTSAQIVIRETEETEKGRRGDTESGLPFISASPRLRVAASVIAVLMVGSLGAGAYWIAERKAHSHPNPMFAPGKVGQAFNLYRDDDFISVPSSPSLSFDSSFTFEAWINPRTLAYPPAIFEKGRNSVNQLALHVFSTGALCGDYNYSTVCSPEGIVQPNQFSHVAFTFDAATHEVKLYANGVVVATDANAQMPKPNADNLIIGESESYPGHHFLGLIDEPSIYNRALSAAEIQAIFNAGSAGKCKSRSVSACVPPPSGLVAWFPGDGDINDLEGGNSGVAVSRPVDDRERVRIAFEMIDNAGRSEDAVPILRDVLIRDPKNAMAHWSLAEAYRYGGMLAESITESELAVKLDPKLAEQSTLNTYFYAGQYQKFIETAQGQTDPPRTLFYRGLVFLYLKDNQRAIAEFDQAEQLAPTYFFARVGQALKAATKGERATGVAILQQLERENLPPDGELFYKVAQAYAMLGDKQAVVRVLGYSIDHGFFCYPYMIQDPMLQSLRGDPEYDRLMERADVLHDAFRRRFF